MLECRLIKPIHAHIKKGHPWIFRDALENPNLPSGEQVKVLDPHGNFCCVGISDSSQIGVRVFSLKERKIDKDFIANRIYKALEVRKNLLNSQTNAVRLIHGEGDFLPGIVLDKYGEYGVLYFDGEGILSFKEVIISVLEKALKAFEIRTLLQLTKQKHERKIEIIYGNFPNEEILILENGMKLWIDIINGQKTGMFLDHRNTRKLVRELAFQKRVLNLFAYTGGFSVAAGLGKAKEVTSVDIAKNALELAERSWDSNHLNGVKHNTVVCDAFEFLSQTKNQYDLIICDPPSFAPNEKSKENALKSYKRLHTLCLSKLRTNGIYVACSCSSHINFELFRKTILQAAKQGSLEFLHKMRAAEDHPVRNSFPEGDYLKVFVLKKIS